MKIKSIRQELSAAVKRTRDFSMSSNFTEDFLSKFIEGCDKDALNFDKLLSIPSKTQEETYAVGYRYYENGKYQEAVNIFRFLILSESHNKKYWLGLGASLQMLKEYAKALEAYLIASSMDETDPYVFLYMSDCLIVLGKIEEALEILKTVEHIARGDNIYDSLITHVDLIRKAWSNQNHHNINKMES